jgi:RNA polymerase sigma factor (sigma-70 family)
VSIHDTELIRRYVDEGANDALAELVRRHVDVIYSAALRQVGGDCHFAEDVVQQVFADFVRKARSLRGHAALTGWFYTSTRFTAAKLVRAEQRRKARDLEAYHVNESDSSSAASIDVRPMLDEAMHELGERDRLTVLLRYFEQQPVAEVGRRLGISENAAAKAVERALDRLRDRFAKRGMKSTSAVLAAALANQAVAAAPAALASNVTSSLLASGAAVATTTVSLFMGKVTCTAIVAGIVVATGIGVFQFDHAAGQRTELAALRVEGARYISRANSVAQAQTAATAELEQQRVAHAQLVAATRVTPPRAKPVGVEPPLDQHTIEKLTSAGFATPIAALETYLWAISTGDAKAIADCITLDAEDHAALRRLFESLSPGAQTYLQSPERMLASVAPATMPSISRLDIVDVSLRSNGDTRVRYRRNDEETVRSVMLRSSSDGWKLVGRNLYPDDPDKQATLKYVAESLAANASK